ncbi:MAG: hypothetical protein CML13_02210 [Puniceicoccaceae bacterium]|nr:hypothetical protein [Puniceicoccaceae bacterium]
MVRDYTATSNFDLTSQQFAAQQTGVVSFDYYTATPADISGDRGLRVTLMNGLGGNPFTYGTQHAVGGFFITGESIVNKASNYRHLDNSGRINYIAGQKNKITIIFNNSSSIFSYGDATVASGKFDIFLNDKKVGTWDLNQGADVPAGTGVTGLWFHIPSSTEGEVLLDNIKFAAMPESSI